MPEFDQAAAEAVDICTPRTTLILLLRAALADRDRLAAENGRLRDAIATFKRFFAYFDTVAPADSDGWEVIGLCIDGNVVPLTERVKSPWAEVLDVLDKDDEQTKQPPEVPRGPDPGG